MECFKRFRSIDSHFASKQILKDFERSNHRRVKTKNKRDSWSLVAITMENNMVLGCRDNSGQE